MYVSFVDESKYLYAFETPGVCPVIFMSIQID